MYQSHWYAVIKEGRDKANERDRDRRNVERDRHIKGQSSGPSGCLINFSECSTLFSDIYTDKKSPNRNKHHRDYPPLPHLPRQRCRPCWMYHCPHRNNSCHLPLFKCQTLLNILLVLLALIAIIIILCEAIILKCSSDCCQNTFKIIITVMYLIKKQLFLPTHACTELLWLTVYLAIQ